MKPYLHAKSSAKKWGGVAEDYVAIHDFMDYSKAFHADVRHRIALHHALGCWVVEEKFGHLLTNSAGKTYSPRDVAEQHCLEDTGTILSLRSWMKALSVPANLRDGVTSVSRYEGEREGFLKVLLRPVDFYPANPVAHALYHNEYGIWLVRDLMGEAEALKAQEWIQNHFGFIPAFEDIVSGQKIQPWMGPPKSRTQEIEKVENEPDYEAILSECIGDPIHKDDVITKAMNKYSLNTLQLGKLRQELEKAMFKGAYKYVNHDRNAEHTWYIHKA